ncbi:MAG TPA: FAD-binding protein [Pseudonocardiaceae bacterium]|nr:FAD-binding protein [Pseudonocardiaceae bacterium]
MNNSAGESIVLPGDPRFGAVTRGFNQRWIADPAYVRLCNGSADVVAAVESAVRDGLRITVRSGGHCYEDFAYGNTGGVIADLSLMNDVYVDAETGWFVVDAGATLFDVYVQLYKQYGVTLPGGSCYSVGAGGHITGGGYGLLSRLHGLTVDYLTAVEVVHVDGNGQVHCDRFSAEVADSAESLMLWGNQGGGGGNFGIVTKFFFADPPAAPSQVCLASESWNWEDFTVDSFTEFLQSYGQFFVDHKDPDDPFQGLFALLHLTCAPVPNIGLTIQSVGDDPGPIHAFRDAVRPAGIRPEPLSIPVGYHGIPASTLDIQVMPWLFATQTLNGSGNPRRGKYKSAYMIGNFTADECQAIWESLRTSEFQNSQALLQVDSYGGQVNAVEPAHTAIPQRSSAMKLQYQTYWAHENDDEANLRWIRDFYAAMYGADGPVPDGRLDGCYVNYPDVDLANWKILYYKENYPKLQQVKRRWDPLDIFNHAQSIE